MDTLTTRKGMIEPATLGLAAASWVVAARRMNGMDMGVATERGSGSLEIRSHQRSCARRAALGRVVPCCPDTGRRRRLRGLSAARDCGSGHRRDQR